MKKQFSLLFIVLSLTSCSPVLKNTVAPRSVVASHMEPIVRLEKRAGEVLSQAQFLAFTGGSDNVLGQLKDIYDIYYVYHGAAAVALAQGDLGSYQVYVDLAERELESMTQLLNRISYSR